MGRALALAVLALALVVLAGCGGSGPGNGGGDLRLSLTGGDPPVSGVYKMLSGETRPIVCTWTGGAVSGDPVWEIRSSNPRVFPIEGRFNAMTLPPRTLSGVFLMAVRVDNEERWNEVRVTYGGQTSQVRFAVDPSRGWPTPRKTAPLNEAGARLEVVADPQVWSTSPAYGSSNFFTDQTGVLEIESRIVGDYPNAPTPQWTAEQTRLEFVGSATGWKVRFEIKDLQYGRFWPLTAKIGEFAVTVGISGNV